MSTSQSFITILHTPKQHLEQQIMRATSLVVLVFLAILMARTSSAADSSSSSPLSQKCATVFQKVTVCLPFATAKAPSPSKECCTTAMDIKNSDPACMCFIIQQIHSGSSDAIKGMGIQESRLLQLPSACKLVNASVADCPSLLHLAPNSPDAAIFKNASVADATTTNTTSPSGTTSSIPMGGSAAASNGFLGKPDHRLIVGSVIVVAIAIFSHAFTTGLLPL